MYHLSHLKLNWIYSLLINLFESILNFKIEINLITILLFLFIFFFSIYFFKLLKKDLFIIALSIFTCFFLILSFFIIPVVANKFSNIFDFMMTREIINTKSISLNNKKNIFVPKVFDINFSNSDLRDLEKINIKEKKTNLLFNDKKRKWYNVEIIHNQKKYKAKIRVKGDTWPHFINKKKSWRIKFKKNNYFNGLKILDILIPNDRIISHEIFALNLAESNELFSPKFKEFVKIKINGLNYGLYQATEGYSKEMIERNYGHEGQVYSMMDLWLQKINQGEGISSTAFDYHYSAYKKDIKNTNEKDRNLYDARFSDFLELVNLNNESEFNREIFNFLDVDKFIKWNSITWLFGANKEYGVHSHTSSNLKWFYNPTNGKFEPILNEVLFEKLYNNDPSFKLFSEGKNNGSFEFLEKNKFIKRIMKNKEINNLRNKFLWKLVVEKKEEILTNYEIEYQKIRPNFLEGIEGQLVFSGFKALDKYYLNHYNALNSNIKFISDRLSFARVILNQSYKDNIDKDSRIIQIEIIPDSISRILINKIKIDTNTFKNIDHITWNNEDKTNNINILDFDEKYTYFNIDGIYLQPNLDDNLNPIYTKNILKLKLKEISSMPNLNFSFYNSVSEKIIDSKNIYINDIVGESINESSLEKINSTNIDTYNENNSNQLIKVNDTTITFPKGDNVIKSNLIIDKDLNLIIHEGTNLLIDPEISIIVYGNLKILGKKNNPVSIKKNKLNSWGSFIVTDSFETVLIKYLNLSGGSESYINGISSTGQMTINNSDVIIENSSFFNSNSEDALNIKNGKILISNTIFKNNYSDAFDGDKVNGIIKNSYFNNNKGDSIDLSFSKVSSENNLIINSSDKAISAGERTNLLVINNLISKNEIGLACKDSSICFITNTNFIDNKQALSAYKKKSEYEYGGKIDIQNSILKYNFSNFFTDFFSEINFNPNNIISINDLKIFSYKFIKNSDRDKYNLFTYKDFLEMYENNKDKFSKIINFDLIDPNISSDDYNDKKILSYYFSPMQFEEDLYSPANFFPLEWKEFKSKFDNNFIGITEEVLFND